MRKENQQPNTNGTIEGFIDEEGSDFLTKLSKSSASPVAPSILALRQRKLRPRLDRTFALSRAAERFGIQTEDYRRTACAIEDALLKGIK